MKLLNTSKLYFKKYNHRILIAFKSYAQLKRAGGPIEKLLGDRGRLRRSLSGGRNGNRLSIFTGDSEFIKELNLFDNTLNIIEYESPVSADHTALMEKEQDKVVTRAKLFRNKYRYAIRFKIRGNMDAINEITPWCIEQFGYNDDKWVFNAYWHVAILLLASKDDLMLAKLSLEGSFLTERVVLFSELQPEPSESEQHTE